MVEFQTLGEMALEGFEVVAKDARGSTHVVATVECTECSSGIGSDYRVEVAEGSARSVRSVYVVAQPSGTISNEIAVTAVSQRPGTPGRRR